MAESPPSSSATTTTTTESSSYRSLATTVNAVLTTIFLVFVVLLFQAGQAEAVWSRCLPSNSPLLSALGPIAKAIPIMLQLLVYGEILPNVCHMLNYDAKRIRISILWGSFIPLVLLTGWAALGVALVPASAAATTVDPVKILLQGGGAVPRRLLVLSVSAIGTTILGSFLALESAYRDVIAMATSWWRQKRVNRTSVTCNNDSALSRRFWQQSWVSAMCITLPPMLISTISPSVFLQAIDFAGSYPILLLYGVIPSLMARRSSTRKNNKKHPKKTTRRYMGLAVLSGAMVMTSFIADVRVALGWVWTSSLGR